MSAQTSHARDRAAGTSAAATLTLPGSPSEEFPRHEAGRHALLTLPLLLALALVLYTPWRVAPYEPTDFSEFLPFVLGADTFGERFGALFEHFAVGQGRFVPLSLAWVAAGWSLFDWNAAAWQWSVWVIMSAVTILSWILLRRLGASAGGASVGAALFVVGTSAAPIWTHVHYSEQLSIVFFLGALSASLSYRTASRWRTRATLIVVLATGAVLTKETMVGILPFLLVVAASHERQARFAWPLASPRILALGIGLAVVGLGAVSAALSFRAGAAASGYGTMYGGMSPSFTSVMHNAYGMFVPVRLSLRLPWEALLFVAVLVSGWAPLLRDRQRRPSHVVALGVALCLSLGGLVVYAPWPLTSHRYAAPFLLGPAMLLAIAVTGLRGMSRARRVLTAAAIAALLLTGAVRNFESTRAFFVERELWADLAAEVKRIFVAHDAREIVLASNVATWHVKLLPATVASFPPPASIPHLSAVDCDTLAARLASPSPRAISIGAHCAAVHDLALPPSRLLVAEYRPPAPLARFVPVIREEARLWSADPPLEAPFARQP